MLSNINYRYHRIFKTQKYRGLKGVFVFKYFIFSVIALFYVCDSYAQVDISDSSKREVRIKNASWLIWAGDSLYFSKDTVLYLDVNKEFKIVRDEEKVSKTLYDSLKSKASKTFVTRELYNLLINDADDSLKLVSMNQLIENQFVPFEGKRIRNINIKVLDAFGTSAYDSTEKPDSDLERTFNSIHIKTSESVIRSSLIFEEGEEVSAVVFAEAERWLRSKPYVYEVFIRPVYVGKSDEVDVEVIVRDIWSIGIYPGLGTRPGYLDVYDLNFLGLGNTFLYRYNYHADSIPHKGIELNYKILSFKNSFFDLSLGFSDIYENQTATIDAQRPFLFPKHFAGGLTMEYHTGHQVITLNNPVWYSTLTSYNIIDFWSGYRFDRVRKKQKHLADYLISRFYQIQFFDRDKVTTVQNRILHNRNLFLLTYALSENKYYKANLIYAFGNTEDISLGKMMTITSGMEYGEFFTRPYFGAELSGSLLNTETGYWYASLGGGTYFREGNAEQGVIRLRLNTFGRLHAISRWKFRQFYRLGFIAGINRFPEETIFLDANNDIKGLEIQSITGTQKLNFNLEMVAFAPVNLVGFKLALYGSADMGFIAQHDQVIFSGDYFTGISAGVRLRNENLVFKTLQLGITYYPIRPGSLSPVNITISGQDIFKLIGFIPEKPSEIGFR